MRLLILLLASFASAQDKTGPAAQPQVLRVTRMEALELRNLALEMQILEAKYAELVKQRSEAVSAICKRAGIEACEIRPDGSITKRDAPRPEVNQ
jgi:hypothetical protein